MKAIILTLSIGMIPALLGMTFAEHGIRAVEVKKVAEAQAGIETADEWESCETDLDCYCKQGYGEPLNVEPVCIEYRKQTLAQTVAMRGAR